MHHLGIAIVAAAPAGAFTLPDVPGVGVVAARGGRRCARSWRITKDVGADPEFPELSACDAAAVREFDARGAGVSMGRSAPRLVVEPPFAAGAVDGGADLALDQAHKWWMLAVYRIEEKGALS